MVAPPHVLSTDLSGQVALVTGATSGLGRRFAQVLAGCGAQVALAVRRVERLEQAAKECAPKNFRGATATVLADSEDKEIRAAFESLQLAMLPLRNDVAARLGARDSA